jgi:quinol monooxygenase YgiN
MTPVPDTSQELLIVATAQALPEQTVALRNLLAQLQAQAHQEPGCLRYDIYLDGLRLLMVERWADAMAFEQHTGTASFAEGVAQLKALLQDHALQADVVTVQKHQSVLI